MKEYVALHTSSDGYAVNQVIGECITVGELIEALRDFDPDLRVVLNNDNDGTYGYVDYCSLVAEQYEEDEK